MKKIIFLDISGYDRNIIKDECLKLEKNGFEIINLDVSSSAITVSYEKDFDAKALMNILTCPFKIESFREGNDFVYDDVKAKHDGEVKPENNDDSLGDFVNDEVDNAFEEFVRKLINEDKIEKTEKKENGILDIIENINNVKKELLKRIKGQDAVINSFLSTFFNLNMFADEDRTSVKGSILFAGPAGVGKTYLARSLAEIINMPIYIVNMAEYSDKDACDRFKGFDRTFKNSRPGVVTSYVDANPKSILVFDEIDKAHNTILNLILQLYSTGTIFDPQLEKEVSFKDVIIIYTTNAGKALYEDEINLLSIPKNKIIDALKNEFDNKSNEYVFPAALISRFASGEVLMFNNLEPYALAEIAKNEFDKKIDIFTKKENIKIEYDDDVINALIYSLGGASDARNIKRACSNYIESEIVTALRQIDAKNLAKLKKIKFKVDKSNYNNLVNLDDTTVVLFTNKEDSKSIIDNEIDGVKYLHTSSLDKVKEYLRKDISFVLIDIKTNIKKNNKFIDLEDISSDGRELISYVLEYHNELPIYLLNKDENEASFESFIKMGIKGIIPFDNDLKKYTKELILAKDNASMAKISYGLRRGNKTLSYRTRQRFNKNTIEIEMYNLEDVVNYSVADDDFVLEFERPTVTFNDVIGSFDAKKTLNDFIWYLKNPLAYLESGMKAPKGILLYGPPGTGKTLLARALAGETNFSFIQKSASDFVNKDPNEVEKLFKKARKYAPTIIFIDEIDAIAKERLGISPTEAILNKFLTEIDGFKFDTKRPILLICATNYPIERARDGQIILDQAFVRRFDRKIKIDLPNKAERIEFIKYYLNKHSVKKISDDCIENVASRTIYSSPANLENLIDQAIRDAMPNELTDKILSDTVDANKYGEIKTKYSAEDIKRTAIHESGHAILYIVTGNKPAFLTITSRSDYGGYMALAENEKLVYTKQELLDSIATALGGRAAEIVMYGNELGLTTGASNDLTQATRLARNLICSFGMEGELIDYDLFNINKDIIDRINKILQNELERAIDIIKNNIDKFNKLVDKLIEFNSLTEKEILEIVG